MKKIFYILLGICVLSCSDSNGDVVEDVQDIYPDKVYKSLVSGLFVTDPVTNPSYYQFTYTDGSLTGVSNKFQTSPDFPDSDFPTTTLFYENNQIKVLTTSIGDSRYTLYTMVGKKPVKSEQYTMSINQQYYLNNTAYYTYEKDKIIISREYTGSANKTVSTHTFDSKHNLIKSEVVYKTKSPISSVNIMIYSDFDNSKNPFKNLWLLGGDTYIKSLSSNNFRKIEYTQGYIDSGVFESNYTIDYTYNNYKYDSKGQLLLYYPL